MAGGDPIRGPESLQGRSSECALLDDVIAAVRGGASRTLLLHGEAGIVTNQTNPYFAEALRPTQK